VRRFALLVLLVSSDPLVADDPKPPVLMQLIELKIKLVKEMEITQPAISNAADKSTKRRLLNESYERSTPFCQKALQLAEENPSDPGSYEALSWIVLGPFGYAGKCKAIIDRAFDLLSDRWVADSRNALICDQIGRFASYSTKPEEFLRALVDRNSSRDVRGRACLNLGEILDEYGRLARLVRNPTSAIDSDWKDDIGFEMLERLGDVKPSEFETQASRAYQRVLDEFAKIKSPSGRTAGEIARGRLVRINELIVGKPMPAIKGFDAQNNALDLASSHGKVVVLFFWANLWPNTVSLTASHGHALLARHGDKRLAVIGVNGDENLTLTQIIIDKERMSWPTFFDGNGGRGPIVTSLGIFIWPTIFVIDADGIIRHVGQDAAKLDDVVADLLKKSN
jgi:peroxiredoxin